jgi:hypothetical protein
MKCLSSQAYLTFTMIVLCLVMFGCQSRHTDTAIESSEPDPFFTISFAEIIKSKSEVSVSAIAESVEYIPLENTSQSMLGNVMDIQLTPEYIFIRHNGSRLLTQFGRDGKFIRHIGKEGRGPKEYGLMRKFSIDEANRLIYIHTNWTHKIMVYNFDGDFIKSLQFGSSGRGLITWSRDSFLVSFSEPHNGDEPYTFIETNFQGDTIQTINNHIYWDETERSSFIVSYWGRNEYYRVDGRLHMKGWYNDTVYTYNTENRLIPKFFIDMKHHKIPDDLVYERKTTRSMPADCYWVGVNESADYVFLRYGPHYNRNQDKMKELADGCILYRKKSKEGVALKEWNGKGCFINDINAGPGFLPKFSNDTLIFTDVTALELKQYLDSDDFKNQNAIFPEQKEKLALLGKALKEDGTHFLMIAGLKR